MFFKQVNDGMEERKKQPAVSFVIPSYRSSGTIRQTVESILNQTKSDWIKEVIVVDSSDDRQTKDVLAQLFHQPLVRVVHLENQTYPGAARNRGAQESSGDLLCFIDSDTILDRAWVEHMVCAFEGGCRAGCGAISLSANQKQSMIAAGQFYLEVSEYIGTGTRRSLRVLPGCNLFCDRKLFFESGGFPDVRASEDALLSLEMGQKTVLWFVPEAKCVHMFRQSAGDFLRTQFLLGKYFIMYRRTYYGAWFYQPGFAALLLPVFLMFKFCLAAARANKAGPEHVFRFLLGLPAYILGWAAWGGGLLQGCFARIQ